MKISLKILSCLAGSLLIGLGCGERESVRVYQAPKDAPAAQSMAPAVASQPSQPAPAQAAATPIAAQANRGEVQWVVPESWKQLPPQQMRYATFQIDPNDPKLNVVVYTFGPESGALLPNVNRWEQQIGAPISQPADLPKVVKHIQSHSLEIDSVDISAPPAAGQAEGQRMLAAIIPSGGKFWFLKLVGPASKVAAHQAEYDAFLKSLSFGVGANVAGAPPANPQPNPHGQMPLPDAANPHGQMPMPANPHAAGGGDFKLKSWTTPEGWAVDPEQRPMRVATFHVKNGDQQADLIISALPNNQFGTPEANINRWRGQVGLEPLADVSSIQQTKIAIGDGEGVILDFVGPEAAGRPALRMLVAQAVKGKNVWFYKLIGPAKLIGDQKKAFESFLKSLQFESAE